MMTEDDARAKEALILHLERTNRILRMDLLDHFAMSAVASGRCAPAQAYVWANEMMKAREENVGS